MKSLTSVLGWLLLLAVLAVPSFLFYNWWTKNKQQASAELAQEQAQANIFPPSDKGQAAQPPARSTAAAPVQPAAPAQVQPAAPAPVSTQPARAEVQPSAAPQRADPSQLTATAPVQPVQASSAPAQAQPPAVSTAPKQVSYFSPKTDRDPTLSPADYSRIKAAELQRIENERQQRLAAMRRNTEPSIESRLQLQGIVGNAAIINGEMYSAGQTVRGAKILKVGTNYVIGEYKGKKFRKVLQ